MFGLDLDWWNVVVVFGLGIAAIAAVIAVVAQMFIIKLQKIEAAEAADKLQKYQSEAAVSVANARAVGEKANERAEAAHTQGIKLEGEASAQRERAAKAEKALLDMQERLAPRKIDQAQGDAAVNALRAFAGQKINLVGPPGSSEIESIGGQLVAILNAAQWSFKVEIGHDQARSVAGMLIEVMPNANDASKKAATALASALKNARLAVTGPLEANPHAMTGVFSGERFPDAGIRLTLGTK